MQKAGNSECFKNISTKSLTVFQCGAAAAVGLLSLHNINTQRDADKVNRRLGANDVDISNLWSRVIAVEASSGTASSSLTAVTTTANSANTRSAATCAKVNVYLLNTLAVFFFRF